MENDFVSVPKVHTGKDSQMSPVEASDQQVTRDIYEFGSGVLS